MKNMSLNDGAPTIFLLTPLREGRPAKTALQSPRCAIFLLTPLREGRLLQRDCGRTRSPISTHAPAGGATKAVRTGTPAVTPFLLTPLREGRPYARAAGRYDAHFYSRPCGRGDKAGSAGAGRGGISTHAPAGGATLATEVLHIDLCISTHAPAGGATCAVSRW